MNTSIDWTTPEAYRGRLRPVPSKRTLLTRTLAQLRVFLRQRQREQNRRAELYYLSRMGRDLPDHVRRDLGLPR
jgi:hypothetical protein